MMAAEATRQIQAVLHIQWLSFRNGLRRRSERIGLLFSIFVTTIWYAIWLAAAAGLCLFSLWASTGRLSRTLPALLLLLLVYWQASPLLTASMGVSIDLRKMALYPLDVKTLFLMECLLRLMTSAEMILVLSGLTVGMAMRAPQQIPIFLPAAALFVLFSVLLSAGLRNLLERLLQRRGFREMFLFLIVMASATPQFILWTGSGEKVGRRVYRIFHSLPQFMLPSTFLAEAYLGRSTFSNWILMIGWCTAAASFGFWQFRRSFYSDFGSGGANHAPPFSRSDDRERPLNRWPGLVARLLPDPWAALVEKEVCYLSRSPRFRFLFLMGCSFGVVAWLPFGMSRGPLATGVLQASFLTVLSLYALLLLGQVTFFNSFGFDRAATRYFFWSPVSPAAVLAAKNLAAVAFLVLEIFALSSICLLLRMLNGFWQFAEALAVTLISSFYLLSVGNLTSILFPAALSPERVSRAGSGRGVQGLIVFLYPLLIFPVLAAYFARYYWHSRNGFLLLLAAAAAGGLALYLATLPLAARLAFLRREKLLQDLSRGEGPLVSE